MASLDQNEADWPEMSEADKVRRDSIAQIKAEEAAASDVEAYRVSKLRTLTTPGILERQDLDIPTFLRRKLNQLFVSEPSDKDIKTFFTDWVSTYRSNPLAILLEAAQRQSSSGEVETAEGVQQVGDQIGTVLDSKKVN